MGSFEIISDAILTPIKTPVDYPKCKCGNVFRLTNYANKKSIHKLTSAICISCNEAFTIYDIADGYKAIPRGQKARLQP